MNTELQEMIERGRKLIAMQADAEQRKIAEAEAERNRLRGVHLSKLPAWMHEYVTVTNWDHAVRICLDLPGCAPIYTESRSWDKGFEWIGVAEPLTVLFSDDDGDWYVSSTSHTCAEIEKAVALAADFGEVYWQMHAQAEFRNAAGLLPYRPANEPVAPEEDQAGKLAPPPPPPPPLERIAVALERIADRLDGFSDNLAEDALRVNVLR